MSLRGTDPESYITEYTSVHEDDTQILQEKSYKSKLAGNEVDDIMIVMSNIKAFAQQISLPESFQIETLLL